MTDTTKPLREFARSGEEAAFRQVVEALGGLVFSCALRRTGDPGMAEEVTQNVFAILARKAKLVAKHPSPEGWIFTTTRLESAMAMRKRQHHQRKLEALADELQTGSPAMEVDAEAWRDVLPHLCDSLDRLAEKEREILLARFFAGNSFSEIAQRVGKSEAACKMRVKRSLEKMKGWMSQRGVSISATALASGLAADWGRAVPAGLSAALPGNALAAAPSLAIGKVFSNSVQTASWLPRVALVAAGIMAVAGIIAVQSRPEHPERPTAQKPEKEIIKLGSALSSELRNREIQLGAIDKLEPAPGDPIAKRRPGFWLPSVELKNATAKEALGRVRYLFRRQGGDEGITFDYELDDDESDLQLVTLELGNVTVEQGLQRIAAEAGADLELRPGGFALVPFPEGGTEIETMRFYAPPDLLSSRGATQASELFPGLPVTATVEYLPATSVLIVTGDARIRARAAALIRSVSSSVRTQVLLNVKFVHAPDDRLGAGARLLSAAETQLLLERIRDDEVAELIVSPTVVTVSGQPATMETLRPVIVGDEEQYVGIGVTIAPLNVAYHLSLVGEIQMSALGELTPSSLRGSSEVPSGERVQSETVGLELTVEPGHSAFFEVLTGENGERIMALITPQEIDPSGQPINR